MKQGVAAILLVVLAGIVHAGDARSSQHVAIERTAGIDAGNMGMEAAKWQQQEIDMAVAPIKSLLDLKRHLRTAADSPLSKLPPHARKAFIDSLVFTPKGVGSYSWASIAGELSVTDTYRLLALFGLPSSTPGVPSGAPRTEVERHMLDVAPMIRHDYDHKTCVIYGHGEYICEKSPGSFCSRACD